IGIEILEELIPIIRQKVGFSSKSLTNYFNSSTSNKQNFEIRKVKAISTNQKYLSDHSLLPLALNKTKFANNFKYHMLVLNCRNVPLTTLNEKLSEVINCLFPGRILAILYESLNNSGSLLSLHKLTDYVLKHGLRLRDKITIQHQPEKQWEVNTRHKSKVVFQHCYYEVLLFQKGKFDYKSKTKQEKEDCVINKEKFQREKWYLTLWDFRSLSRNIADSIVLTRLLELFLFNDEVVGTNIANISCSKRQFTLDLFTLI
ncbi:MAG: hypothetical protein ACFFDT_18865, partial [Candidatus Hodarchaeota archaeon]